MIFNCVNCNKQFESIYDDSKYCSRKCRDHVRYLRRKERGYQQKDRNRPSKSRPIKILKYIYDDKMAKGCSRCSERRPNCLQYHHLDKSTKKQGISKIRKFDELVEEMAKCILLCANCHAIEETGTGFEDPSIKYASKNKADREERRRKKSEPKPCLICGSPLKSKHYKYCSEICYNESRRILYEEQKKDAPIIFKYCRICYDLLEPGQLKYCSSECSYRGNYTPKKVNGVYRKRKKYTTEGSKTEVLIPEKLIWDKPNQQWLHPVTLEALG